MIQLQYTDIISKIKEKGLSDEEIKEKINKKIDQLSGLLSREGAAQIIANELGINLFENLGKEIYKINQIMAGIRNVNTIGKVVRKYEIRNFQNKNGEGKVGSVLLGDETGFVRIALWGGMADNLNNLNEGDIIKIKGAYSKMNNGFMELHLTERGSIIINPEGVDVGEIKEIKSVDFKKKKISELNENDENVGVFGTIVMVFDPRFYKACPKCGKKVEENFCNEHGSVSPEEVPIVNIYFDDGEGNLRATAFRNQAERLLEINANKFNEIRDDMSKFEEIKRNILGKQLILIGKVNKSNYNNNLEFLIQRIHNVSPKKIAEELQVNEA